MHLLYDGYYTSFPIKFFLWRPDNLRQLFIATWASQQIPYFLKVWKGFTCAISLNKAKLQQDGIAPLIVYLTERACEAIKHNLAFETFPTKKKWFTEGVSFSAAMSRVRRVWLQESLNWVSLAFATKEDRGESEN